MPVSSILSDSSAPEPNRRSTRPTEPRLEVSSNPAGGSADRPGRRGPDNRGGGAGLTLDDHELMDRVREDDRDAFEEIVDRYWGHVFIYARSMAPDSDTAMDLTQEAFLRLWKRRAQWVQTGSVRVWLLRTVRNLTISEQRRWKVRSLWATKTSAEGVPLPRTPLQDTETRELRSAILEAVEKLSPRRREAFTLFHLQGLSYREIADLMEVREQTVANYLQAALADLRVSLSCFFPDLRSRHRPPDDDSSGESEHDL
jgi:RNA polymerase sigma-70 factor, ECF subfamily